MKERYAEKILETLAEKISILEVDVYLKESEIERLKEENAELRRQRDALCRKDGENG
jgi:FtsZ-binding cell division protein ZapB